MKQLNNITIRNFRGFENIKVDGFNQINLFIGRNNSGKTTILESIFLLIGMSNPALPENINRLRGLNIKDANEFKYLFHKLKFSNKPEFECIFDDFSERKLVLNPIFKKNINTEKINKKVKSDEFAIDASTSSPLITGLELDFSSRERQKPKKPFKSSIIFNPPEISHNINNVYKEELHAVFVTGNSDESNALSRFSEIVKRKKGQIILDALQKIDPNIESIHPLPDGLYFSYYDIEELMPSNIAGDGVRKFLNIVTTLAERKNSVVLIDEIENGLHYSAHKQLWASIITISKEFNVQLFISSHNIETLNCLKELLEESNYQDFQKKLCVYTISHTKKIGVKAYKYTFEGFKDAIETETEIR
ncbi:MAG: AAA family ATPase [Salinivirgaceae bacterium]|nr:AAA family ATPase [Salinivirgaceae bacterium]